MHTPDEAIAELEHAVRVLGMKVVTLAGYVRRPIPSVAREQPGASPYAYWFDNLCIDSEYDYDPVWAKCVELGVTPTFHSAGYFASRTTISSHVFNRIGHFAAAAEPLCKGLFLGGVTRRFPTLKFAFLECGVGWACALYSDLVAHWKKRNINAIQSYNPDHLDWDLFLDLCRRYGGPMVEGKLAALSKGALLLDGGGSREDAADIDEFASCGITKPEEVRDLFAPHFYFGCEADDPTTSWSFDAKRLPYGAKLKAIFSSDIGHWDVPDMTEVTEEAYELVEHGLMTEDDFRDFVFVNPVKLWVGMNPDFFKGTRVEGDVNKLLAAS
jgi:hypothetical protein